jgi:hypothetical protein
MANKPLVSAKSRGIIGAKQDSSAFRETGQDLTFVPGYSDVRRRIDSSLARGERPEERLDVRLQYVTVEKANGAKTMAKAAQFKALGYKFVEFDSPPEGISVPDHAFKSADGHIQVGDTQLMYCDSATAERNYEDGRSAIDAMSAEDTTSNNLHSAGREVGGRRNDMTESSLEQNTEVVKGR